MNLVVKWAAIATTAVAALYLMMPQERLDQAHESWSRLTHDSGQACLDYERQRLKDPDSARLLSVSTADNETTVKYKAKNSYGAYGQSESVCVVDEQGKVNEFLTQLARQNKLVETDIKLMDADTACLEKRIKLMRGGITPDQATKVTGRCNTAKH